MNWIRRTTKNQNKLQQVFFDRKKYKVIDNQEQIIKTKFKQMKRLKILLISIVLFFSLGANADEGMWLVNLISKYNLEQMHKLGCELTTEQIYSINHSSAKDAVVALDYGSCTGEFVSDKGLLLTNHHCAYDNIQELSTSDKNFLANGFWAQKFEDEIPIKGKTASVLIRVEDITDRVKADIKKALEAGPDKGFMMRKISGNIEKEMNAASGLETSLASTFTGNKYYLYYYKVYKDVRLVGAPPSSIGAYGGDTDNWMWPQHKGDFAMYRVYSGTNGEPAEYSTSNVPYKPAYFFTISLKGVEENDYTMVMGYPYSTNRNLSSYGVKQQMEVGNPALIKVRGDKLSIMKKAMDSDEKIRIQYASKFFNSSNYYKNTLGQNKYLAEYKVIDIKRASEAEFTKWVEQNPDRITKYGKVLTTLSLTYDSLANYDKTEKYYQEAMINGCDLLRFLLRGKGLESALKKESKEKKVSSSNFEAMKSAAKGHFKDYNESYDKVMFAVAVKNFVENVDPAHVSIELKEMIKRFKGDYSKMADYVYAKSFFANLEKLDKYIAKPTLKGIQTDPAFIISSTTLDIIYKLRDKYEGTKKIIRTYNKLYVEGLTEMKNGENIYPDANSTMRFTYGTVGGFSPRDAVNYSFITTVKGYLEKENPKDHEFIVDPAFKKLLLEKNFGRYADKDGQLRVDFVTNNDITGGNSGSPVLNAKGQLIGIAFDGNWESMASDIYFHPELNKTICVDIRYVLFIIDKYAKATNLMNEISIVE